LPEPPDLGLSLVYGIKDIKKGPFPQAAFLTLLLKILLRRYILQRELWDRKVSCRK